jgi:hypothetical protein
MEQYAPMAGMVLQGAVKGMKKAGPEAVQVVESYSKLPF